MQVWVNQTDCGEYFLSDIGFRHSSGPVEISNELYERIMEHDRQTTVFQDIMASLEYEWQYPDNEEMDCE